MRDSIGRTLDVAVLDDYVIYYWADFADRHLTVMAITKGLKVRPEL